MQQDTGYIRGTYSCVWRLWVVFLEYGCGALGIFNSPAFTSNQSYDPLSASHYFSFLSKRSKRSGRRILYLPS